MARRVEQVKREPLMLEAHHRRGDQDAALTLDRHPIRAHPPPLALTSPASWIAPPNSSKFSVNEGLAGSSQRCAAAQSRKRRIASALRTDQAAAIASSTMCVIAISTATQRAARSTLNPIWRSDVKMDMSISNRRQGYDAR